MTRRIDPSRDALAWASLRTGLVCLVAAVAGLISNGGLAHRARTLPHGMGPVVQLHVDHAPPHTSAATPQETAP